MALLFQHPAICHTRIHTYTLNIDFIKFKEIFFDLFLKLWRDMRGRKVIQYILDHVFSSRAIRSECWSIECDMENILYLATWLTNTIDKWSVVPGACRRCILLRIIPLWRDLDGALILDLYAENNVLGGLDSTKSSGEFFHQAVSVECLSWKIKDLEENHFAEWFEVRWRLNVKIKFGSRRREQRTYKGMRFLRRLAGEYDDDSQLRR